MTRFISGQGATNSIFLFLSANVNGIVFHLKFPLFIAGMYKNDLFLFINLVSWLLAIITH